MNKLITSLFIIISTACISQPVITSSMHNVAGYTVTYTQVDGTGLTEGSGGANQVWNYSTLTPSGTPYTSSYMLPAGTPYAANFPGATLASSATDGSGGFVYTYYNHNASITELLGLGYVVSGNTIIFNYSNPQTVFNYPVNYNGTGSDVFAGFYTVSIMGVTVENYRSGSMSYLADGYGTISLPTGTHANTMRVKIVQESTDSSIYVGAPLPPVVTHFNSTMYNFITADPKHKLNEFYISYDTTTSQTGTTMSKTVLYQSNLTTGVNENFSLHSASFYPNPAKDHILLQLHNSVNGNAEMAIYDMRGSIVKTIKADMKQADRYEWMFPVADLSDGLYVSKITCGDNIWSIRFVKE